MHKLTQTVIDLTLSLGYGSPEPMMLAMIRASGMCLLCSVLTKEAIHRDLYAMREQLPFAVPEPEPTSHYFF